MEQVDTSSLVILNDKDIEVLRHVGKTILGVPPHNLNTQFYKNIDDFISKLEPFLQGSIKRIFLLLRTWGVGLFFVGSIKPFPQLSETKQLNLLNKWRQSRVRLLRTAYITLQSLVGWGYYVLDEVKEEIGHLGPSLGRENETPTLLYGKEPWTPGVKIE